MDFGTTEPTTLRSGTWNFLSKTILGKPGLSSAMILSLVLTTGCASLGISFISPTISLSSLDYATLIAHSWRSVFIISLSSQFSKVGLPCCYRAKLRFLSRLMKFRRQSCDDVSTMFSEVSELWLAHRDMTFSQTSSCPVVEMNSLAETTHPIRIPLTNSPFHARSRRKDEILRVCPFTKTT